MSLATRCTACGTIFRVVQDQLRISEGWVRCGRCAEVFDAGEQLFDIDREAPPPWPADAQASHTEIEPRPQSRLVDHEEAPYPQASQAPANHRPAAQRSHLPDPASQSPWAVDDDMLPAADDLEAISAKTLGQQGSWARAEALEDGQTLSAPPRRQPPEPAFANSRLEPQWFEGEGPAPAPVAAPALAETSARKAEAEPPNPS